MRERFFWSDRSDCGNASGNTAYTANEGISPKRRQYEDRNKEAVTLFRGNTEKNIRNLNNNGKAVGIADGFLLGLSSNYDGFAHTLSGNSTKLFGGVRGIFGQIS